ncbi:MAG: sigma-54 dependent transcriptional regulator [bacterium]
MARILVVDDDASLREVLAFALRDLGHQVEVRADGASALDALGSVQPDLVVTDLKMPGIDGREVLRRVVAQDATIPVIILTAHGSIEDAVEAMKEGAHDYLTKPYNRDELRLVVEHALERRRLVLENRRLRETLRERTRAFDLVHASAVLDRILETIRRVAPSDATVLLSGESGTGKEILAQLLHSESDRWERPFVAVNCAAIPHDLLESELFGHAKGAFTGAIKEKPGKFQRADGGTLFLDEVGELAGELQSKLLRVLETKQVDVVGGTRPVEVDVRLVAATNADLAARVREGRFRSDLYYRLHVIPIHVPPLRERTDDIPALWEHFVKRFAGADALRSTPGLLRALQRRTWPGNVRELANVCQRMVLLRTSGVLDVADLPPEEGETAPAAAEAVAEEGVGAILRALPGDRLPLLDLEREIIVRALAKHDGNRTRTAEYLQIPRHVLLYRIEKFAID